MSKTQKWTARLESLEIQHRTLDEKIEVLEAERTSDDYIKPLKVKKLQLRDEINDLKNEFLTG